VLRLRRHTPRLTAAALACACLAFPAIAPAQSSSGNGTGGASAEDPALRPPGKARLGADGRAIPPSDAPPQVVAAIEAANRIATKPYRYGGGHARVEDTGYDCSGAVSYALIGAGLLTSPLDSSSFMRWGARGRGRWITVYTNPGHAFVVIAGLRFDTGGRDAVARRRGRPGTGPRWAGRRSTRGYKARHPVGF
jgi:cell wall-associated NlpC family hydrolase